MALHSLEPLRRLLSTRAALHCHHPSPSLHSSTHFSCKTVLQKNSLQSLLVHHIADVTGPIHVEMERLLRLLKGGVDALLHQSPIDPHPQAVHAVVAHDVRGRLVFAPLFRSAARGALSGAARGPLLRGLDELLEIDDVLFERLLLGVGLLLACLLLGVGLLLACLLLGVGLFLACLLLGLVL